MTGIKIAEPHEIPAKFSPNPLLEAMRMLEDVRAGQTVRVDVRVLPNSTFSSIFHQAHGYARKRGYAIRTRLQGDFFFIRKALKGERRVKA